MDFLDVDRVLDKRAVIVYPGNFAVSQFSRKNSMSLQSAIHMGDGTLEVSYFIPEELSNTREVSMLLAQTGARKDGNLYFMNYPITRSELYDALDGLFTRARSAVLDNIYMQNGDYHLLLRFHDNDLPFLSNYLIKAAANLKGLDIAYLGESPGIDAIVSEIGTSFDVARIEWSAVLPEKSLLSEPFRSLGDEWVSEIRYMTSGTGISEIFRTPDSLQIQENSRLRVVSQEDNLYELVFGDSNSFITQYHVRSYQAKIVRFQRTLHYRDGILNVLTVVPRMQANNALQILSQCSRDMPGLEITIKGIEYRNARKFRHV